MSQRTWDVFQFCDELDMLECRLRTMDWVHRHVLVESLVTHQGDPKPLYFAENRERFAPWKDRITQVVSWQKLPGASPWDRLRVQQDQGVMGCLGADPDDVILVSDVDEMLPPEAGAVELPWELTGFRPRIMMYAVDWEYPGRFEGLPEPRMIRAKHLTTITDARNSVFVRELPGGQSAMGFHFTWLGGTQAQVRKLTQTCHDDMTPHQRGLISSGATYRDGLHVSGKQMIPVDVDETWPGWIARRECPPEWYRPR